MAEVAKKDAKEAKEGGGGGGGGPAKGSGVPRDSMYRSLFTPAGWAFSIWGRAWQKLPATSASCHPPRERP